MATSLPLPPQTSDAFGIFQSDLIIRTALLAALADLRANPFLLDYVFSSLTKDALTVQAYGGQEIQNAKKWFLDQEVRVVMNTQMNAGDKLPCISISLTESAEVASEGTLGDIHYQYLQDLTAPWPDLTTPFTPTSWTPSTGMFILPPATGNQLDPVEGLIVIDQAGNQYPVTDVLDGLTLVISGGGPNSDFTNCTIRGPQPSFVRHMESASFRETYSLGIHVHGEPVYLTYLHSVVVFVLLRYREVLLEGRGFERSGFSSSDMARNAFFSQENVFSRYVSITGYVRQSWPKQIVPKITSVMVQVAIGEVNETAPAPLPVDPSVVKPQLWIGSGDISDLPEITAGYGLHGNDESPGPPDNGPADGPQGPAVAPVPNGQMDSVLQNLDPTGTYDDIEDV